MLKIKLFKILFIFILSSIFKNMQSMQDQETLNRDLFSSDIEIVKKALASGANINAQDEHGYTPIINASCNGNITVVKFLIEAGADLTITSNSKWTVLMHNIYSQRENSELELAKLLINSSCSINAMSKDNVTALNQAVAYHRNDLVELLINARSNVYTKTHYNQTTLEHAIDCWNHKATELIQTRIKQLEEEFIHAAQEGETKVLIDLIEQGVDINAQGEFNITALIRAAQGSKKDPDQAKRKLDIVKILLQHKANTSLTDNIIRYSALQWAKECDNKEAVNLLENHKQN